MTTEPPVTVLPKYYKDSTEVIMVRYDPHRIEPCYSVFKQEDAHPTHRQLAGEFVNDKIDDALTFCKTYLEMIDMPEGESLVVVNHKDNTSFIYKPEAQ